MNYIFLFMGFLLWANLSETIEHSLALIEPNTSAFVEFIFGKFGLQFSAQQQEKIQTMCETINKLNTGELLQRAESIVYYLQKQAQETELNIQSILNASEHIPYALFFKQFLLEAQINHTRNYADELWQRSTFFERVQWYLQHSWYYVIGETFCSDLQNQIEEYIEFEREYILSDYDNLILFLVHKNKAKNALPRLIDFWNNDELAEKLKKRAKQIEQPKVQAGEFLLGMALQGLVMAGGSLSAEWVDEEDKKLYEEYAKQQETISNDFSNFQQQLEHDRTDAITKNMNEFKSKQDEIRTTYATLNQDLNQEVVYLNQSINIDKPINHYLDNWLNWDNYFSTSVMLTPRKNAPWFNLFNVFNNDDWQFDYARNSFWQNNVIAMPTKFYWEKNEQERNFFKDDPATHSIFTEYITGQAAYDIEIVCKVIACQYPFFVGVMFNRGRWISGDPERLSWYRLVGLHGKQGADNAIQPTIKLAFAQQKIKFAQTENEKEKIITPLEQILSGDQSAFMYTLDQSYTHLLKNNPVTFVLHIHNQPTTATFSLQQIEDNKNVKQIYNSSVNNLDSYIYRYHGIGFMAIGCQAEFTVRQPKVLQYTQQELNDIKQEIEKTS